MKNQNRRTKAAGLAHTLATPPISLNHRELATILAALRFHQDENLQGQGVIADVAILDIATYGGTLKALSSREIDALCTKLNANA